MGDGFSWTGGGPQSPTIPEGKKPSWTEDHKACALPVEFKPNSQYRLGLNSKSFHGSQSADGVPLAGGLHLQDEWAVAEIAAYCYFCEALSAWSMSLLISSTFSRPMERRT
jgi:hypothetical protein